MFRLGKHSPQTRVRVHVREWNWVACNKQTSFGRGREYVSADAVASL